MSLVDYKRAKTPAAAKAATAAPDQLAEPDAAPVKAEGVGVADAAATEVGMEDEVLVPAVAAWICPSLIWLTAATLLAAGVVLVIIVEIGA